MKQKEKDAKVRELSDKLKKLNPTGNVSDLPLNSEYWVVQSELTVLGKEPVEPDVVEQEKKIIEEKKVVKEEPFLGVKEEEEEDNGKKVGKKK